MSRAIRAGWALSIATTLASPALAASFPEKPPKESFIVDRANVIKPAQREAINKTANALLREQEVPIFVVTIGSLAEMNAAGSSVEQYATALFNNWGIGSQEKNLGVLLLVSIGDRKARIELGSSWGTRHNVQAANVMQSLIIPAFKRNDYSTGIADGVRGLDAMVKGLNLPRPTPPWWFLPALIAGGILTIAAIVNLFRTGHSGWAWLLIAGIGGLLLWAMHTASQTNSSGGFGGGSSDGGGGASGEW